MGDKEIKTLEELGKATAQAENGADISAASAGAAEDSGPKGAGNGGEKSSGPEAGAAPVYEQKLDAHGRAYATGKRKNAVARVWIKPGNGKITVNGREFKTYFARPVLQLIIHQPILAAERKDQYDIVCTVKGGGLSGQAGAVRHGVSKALTYYEPELRAVLKKGGFLTRDSRIVERKKYGKAKARKSFQFSKR